MRISCPFCGSRDISEFVSRGEAKAFDPVTMQADTAFDLIHLRDNPIGRTREYFYHAQGCRSWLVVERDVRTHEIFAVTFANEKTQS
ncbi:MAG: sarcosine oxidase subunit delta [Caulobacterales bacterium]